MKRRRRKRKRKSESIRKCVEECVSVRVEKMKKRRRFDGVTMMKMKMDPLLCGENIASLEFRSVIELSLREFVVGIQN
jgi:hypothetical protein